MASIIAGTFESHTEAERFREALINADIGRENVSVIRVGSTKFNGSNSEESAIECTDTSHRCNGVCADRLCETLVAVHAEDNVHILSVALMLKRHGAKTLEWATGTWKNGRWNDFSVSNSPRLVGPIDDELCTLLS